MGGDEDRHSPSLMNREDLLPNSNGDIRIEAHCGFIQKENLRVVNQRFRERESLLRPGRELVKGDISMLCQVENVDQCFDLFLTLFPVSP